MITNFKIFKNKKEYVLLVGPPGSGKSTFIKKLQKNNDYDIINRDDVVIEVAERNGLTYKEMFSRPNHIFLKTGKNLIPDDSDFYVDNGNKYLKNFEYLGEIVDVDPNEYLSKLSPTKFKKLYELNVEVEDIINKKLEYSIRKKRNIIIDMTNNNEYNRKQIIGKLKFNRHFYKVIAAVFNNGGQGMEDILIKINRLRDIPLAKIGRDKVISDETIRRFLNNYEPPTKSEGIDKIIFVDTKTKLEKLVKNK
jgi:predicted kinase